MRTKIKLSLLFLLMLTMQTLNADRACVVAGSFYSKDAEKLSIEVKQAILEAKTFKEENIQAIVVPHAGYVFSAPVAALAYKTLHKKYKNIFLIGSSHHVNFNGASIYNIGSYKTPLGKIKMSQNIISSLMKNSLFSYQKDAHTKEHTIEVQLPFLQTIYGNELSIVPIIIGTQNTQSLIEISKLLKPYFDDEENLFIISTDLSHYPLYEDANSVDARTLNAISENNPQKFINTIIQNEKSSTKGLLTSACGWSSVLILLNMTENEKYKYEILGYKNSGDTKYGDKKRVVGYGAIRVYKETQEFFLNAKEKTELLEIAKLALYEATLHNKKLTINEDTISPKLRKNLGAFVTLNKGENLRGCIGRFEPNQPLYEVVIEMAIAASRYDNRFSPVSKEELQEIDLEISVLTPRVEIESLDEIVVGKHGIYVQKGALNGTYLPHVATQMNWNAKELVEDCAINKAGIKKDEIKDAKLFTYEAIVFDDK